MSENLPGALRSENPWQFNALHHIVKYGTTASYPMGNGLECEALRR
jgi:hypothetical protein